MLPLIAKQHWKLGSIVQSISYSTRNLFLGKWITLALKMLLNTVKIDKSHLPSLKSAFFCLTRIRKSSAGLTLPTYKRSKTNRIICQYPSLSSCEAIGTFRLLFNVETEPLHFSACRHKKHALLLAKVSYDTSQMNYT